MITIVDATNKNFITQDCDSFNFLRIVDNASE